MFSRRRLALPSFKQDWRVDVVALMLSFESLGDNCEFGLLQRRCGADPQGLLRLSHSRLSTVEALLAGRCAGVMDETDIAFSSNTTYPDKIIARSLRLDDLSHEVTPQTRGVVTPADHASNVRRILYLKRRFLEDLREGAKIFVRRGKDSRPETIGSLLALFRQLSQAWLLLVVDTEDARLQGTVVQVGPRYMVGYVGRIAITGDVLDSEVETWMCVLLRAYGIVHGGGRHRTAPKLRRNALLALSMLERFQDCKVRRLCQPSRDEAVFAVEFTRQLNFDETAYAVEFAGFPADLRSFVCSIWLFVPTSFSGNYIRLLTTTAARQMDRQADLRKREVWQRVWVLGHVRRGTTRIRVELRTDSPVNTVLKFAHPTIEAGTYPNAQDAPATQCHELAV